jgi:hypothetical protein
VVVDSVRVVLPGGAAWTAVGLRVRRGERVTLLGSGRVRWADGHDGGARYHLRARIGAGPPFGCVRDTTTVVADRSGPLELAVRPGPTGEAAGALAVTAVRWPRGVDPAVGLAELPDGTADRGLAAAERARLLDPVVPPAGWAYPPGRAGEVFRHAVLDGERAVEAVCDDDDADLGHDLDVPLRPGTAVRWQWRVAELPGAGPEDGPLGRDLLGVAASFDDGSRITWFWSTVLVPEDDAFADPSGVHVPVRRGPAGLGRWRREGRDVHADHERFVGPAPARVVAVRLVTTSHFAHRRARATFRDITLGGVRAL